MLKPSADGKTCCVVNIRLSAHTLGVTPEVWAVRDECSATPTVYLPGAHCEYILCCTRALQGTPAHCKAHLTLYCVWDVTFVHYSCKQPCVQQGCNNGNVMTVAFSSPGLL